MVAHGSAAVNDDGLDAADVASDEGLRRALSGLIDRAEFAGTREWEAIGTQVLALAARDARHWLPHASEHASAYTSAVIEFLRCRPQGVIQARSPWGLLVTKGRNAGRRAVGAQVRCGLTGRDAVAHRTRHSTTPRVLSLDWLADAAVARERS